MSLSPHFPEWMYLYFAVFGSTALILVTLVFWTWMKVNHAASGQLRAALKWNAVGYGFLFIASWFACGIGAGPGNLLSSGCLHAQPISCFDVSRLWDVRICRRVGLPAGWTAKTTRKA